MSDYVCTKCGSRSQLSSRDAHHGDQYGTCERCDDEDSLLIAAAPVLVRALLLCDWQGGGGRTDAAYCPTCGIRDDWEGKAPYRPAHSAGCALDAALTAAGLPDQASRDAVRRTFISERK